MNLSNLAILKGHLGGDPEVKKFEHGQVCKFSLATSKSYTKDGEKITKTTWHNIVFSGEVCEVIKKFFKKGDQILVAGEIDYRSYEDKEGNTRNITEIRCHSFEFCGVKKEQTGQSTTPKEKVAQNAREEFPGYVNSGDVPDEMPF
jgi:single-strand DNA-binding protein